MALTIKDASSIYNILHKLDTLFPLEKREDDFPKEVEFLDIIITLDSGFIMLDDDNQFVFTPESDANTSLVEQCMHPNVIDTEEPDTEVIDDILQKISSNVRYFADEDARSVYIDIADYRPTRIRRFFHWTRNVQIIDKKTFLPLDASESNDDVNASNTEPSLYETARSLINELVIITFHNEGYSKWVGYLKDVTTHMIAVRDDLERSTFRMDTINSIMRLADSNDPTMCLLNKAYSLKKKKVIVTTIKGDESYIGEIDIVTTNRIVLKNYTGQNILFLNFIESIEEFDSTNGKEPAMKNEILRQMRKYEDRHATISLNNGEEYYGCIENVNDQTVTLIIRENTGDSRMLIDTKNITGFRRK